ncbi:MAG: hypothetical protein ACP5G1_02255 [Nanopusillaceae archaeon]
MLVKVFKNNKVIETETAKRIAKYILKPLIIDDEIIEKEAIVCDCCNAPVFNPQLEEDLKKLEGIISDGYAVIEKVGNMLYLKEVICESCRQEYYKKYKVL